MATASGNPIAVKYVQIVPTLKGGFKALNAQLDPAVQETAKTAGDKLGKGISASLSLQGAGTKIQGLGKSISTVGGKLTDSITKPAGIAAGAVAGLVGALGFKRLVGIDTARGQFKGLGLDADEVMKQVDKGVTNTALSMAEGASLAVGILATGAVPLEDLEDQIKRVANVSAAYNVDSEHAAYLLNNVLTKQKVTWGDLSQMQQNQIPIVSQLADHYGVTGEAIMEMAQNGEISIEDLNTVIDQNAGAAAEEYAKTWKGVTSNIMSNIGRLGAEVLGGVFPEMKDGAASILDALKSDDMKATAQQFGEQLREVFDRVREGIHRLIEWWQNLSPAVQGAIVKVGMFAVAAGPVVTVIGKIVSAVGLFVGGFGKIIGLFVKMGPIIKGIATGFRVLGAAMAANPIGAIITAVAALTAALVWFFTKTELGQKIWSGFMDILKSAWENYGQPVIDAIGAAFTWLQENVFEPVINHIMEGWERFTEALHTAWEWLNNHVFEPIKTVLNIVGKAFELYWTLVTAYWTFVKDALLAGWNFIKDRVFEPIKKGVQWVVDKFDTAKSNVSLAWDMMKDSLKRGWDWIDTRVFEPIKKGVGWVVDKFEDAKRGVSLAWDTMKDWLKRGWDWINEKVFAPLKKGTESMSKAFEVAKDMIKTQWDKLKSIAAKPINFIIESVYRDGIKKLVENTASRLGLTISLPTIKPIALNRGGRLPGFGGGDRIPALLEAGEFVINKHAASAFHPLLAAINGGYGVAPGTVGHAMGGSMSSGCGGGGCGIPGLNKGGWLGNIGAFFGDVGRGIGAFLRDPLGAVAELITKPVEALMGPVADTVWGDLGKGGIKKILSIVPDWFKKKSETIGNAGLVGAAQKALGVPYVWGGSSIPPGLDCSGLVYWAAQQLGLGWPRLTAAGYQSASSTKGLASAVPGDLLFWGRPAHHVGIYTGPGQMVHAPRPGTVVQNAAIYGSPSVGTYAGGGGAGLRSTYAGLVSSTAARANSSADFVRQLRMQQYDQGGTLPPGFTLAFNGTGKNETIRTHEQEQALWRRGIGTVNINMDVSELEDVQSMIDFAKRLGVKLMMAGAG